MSSSKMSARTGRREVRRSVPAKINLGLYVLRKRSDGYHDITTVLLPIEWQDELSVTPADEFRFTCSDPSLPTDGRNLCVRAAHVLAAHAGLDPHGAVHLEKRIPYGAGLGGGSSDAARALHLLAAYWGLDLSPADLHPLALRLGSDVPFFLYDQAMIARGRGGRLAPLSDEPYHLPYPLVVVKPEVHVSTADAYARVRPNPEGEPSDLGGLVRSNDLERWRSELGNDFEAPVFEAYPEIAMVKGMLEEVGAQYAALSGSGSAVFGVFEQAREAIEATAWAREAGHVAWASVEQRDT